MFKPILVTLLMLGFTGHPFALERTNVDLLRDVSVQVNRYAYFTIFDSVHASVDAGHVTLSGKVTMPYKASELEKRVARIDGVKSVRNAIEVLPVSSFDDSLRWRIARAVYAHPALSMYGLGPNPSTHVIVEHGRVTLDGVVNNEMDRIIAQSVARSFLSFDVENELKTTEEMVQQMEQL